MVSVHKGHGLPPNRCKGRFHRIRLSLDIIMSFLCVCLGLKVALAQEPPGTQVPRRGDEIMVCGQLFHTTAPVVLWLDPGGYDAYRVERRFVPWERASWESTKQEVTPHLTSPNRYGLRADFLTKEELEKFRGGGWDLESLQRVVDQFVLHYDVCGTSQKCFQVLHDDRGLSVHFMLDIDGTIYQTLDLKERAWHATISNSRSIGVEIANIGAYPVGKSETLDRWYPRDANGEVRLAIPATLPASSLRVPGFSGRPIRQERIRGVIQGTELEQHDFTAEQYASLVKLTATLCKVFPKIRCAYPVSEEGMLIPHKLPDDQLRNYQGILGHYHIQTNKIDPGPALQWEMLIGSVRKLVE
jgi:N-acetylmuramoyl-L-alanine amidase